LVGSVEVGGVGGDAEDSSFAVVDAFEFSPAAGDEVFVLNEDFAIGADDGALPGGEAGAEASVALALLAGAAEGDRGGGRGQGEFDLEFAGIFLGRVSGQAEGLADDFFTVGDPDVVGQPGF